MPRVGAVVDPFHAMVAGEPVAGTTGMAGSGRGPLEKDLHYRHLANGLPVRWRPKELSGRKRVDVLERRVDDRRGGHATQGVVEGDTCLPRR
jgi:hypothetical protein